MKVKTQRVSVRALEAALLAQYHRNQVGRWRALLHDLPTVRGQGASISSEDISVDDPSAIAITEFRTRVGSVAADHVERAEVWDAVVRKLDPPEVPA